MASSTSPLFLIDGATLGSANARFLANFRRKMSIQNLNFRYQRNPKSAGDNLGRCFLEVRRTAGCSWRMLRLRSARNGFAEGGGYEESSEDAIQETIEKSKKVLALQKEILQKIAERRKLLHSVKNSIVDPVNGETFNESVGTMGQSITSAPSAGSKGSDSQAFDEEHSTASFPSVSSKHSSNSTSGSSASSGNLRRKDFRPERVLVDMDSSDTEDIPRSSAEFSGNHSYSENGMDSVKKTEGMSDTPAFLSNRASSLLYDKTSQVKEVTSDMSDLTLSKASPVEEVSNDMNEPTPLAGNNVMNIVLVAAECAPWSKTGGLGDVIAALPKALARRGHRVMVVVPRYDDYPEAQNTGVLKRYKVAGQDFEVSYYHAYIDGVDFVFIDCALFRGIGKNIYGGNRQDILRRMVLFCKAAIEVPWHVPCGGVCYGDGNLAFIANDWHTALLPVYLKAYYHDNGLMIYARSVLVIHNIAHQGRGPLAEFSYVDLPAQYLDSFRLYDPVGGEHLNIFAAGLKAAHRIVTVSHGYAWELKTQEGGWGLHNIINESDWKLRGIVNGIDTKEWSPESDVYLQSDGYVNYSLETLNVGKLQCKVALQRELGLPVKKEVPLIGFIGRLDHQKGVDIIGESIPWMMEQDVQLVMLGTGRPDLEQMLKQFQSEHHDRVRGWVGFSVKTAHRITAGADILLMPSRFEPCGLNQLYAMRYGTVPVVHAVGGLKDTVEPFDPFNDSGYGWTFHTADSEKLKEALWNCLLTFREYRQSFEALQRRGMMRNLSWDRAAEMYEEEVVAAKYQW